VDDLAAHLKGIDQEVANIGGAGSPLDVDNLYYVVDEKSSGTNGGSSSSGRQTRDLNTERVSNITNASLSTNTISLPSGDYWIDADAPARYTDSHKIIFRNTSDNSDEIIGTTEHAQQKSGANEQTKALLSGFVSIGASKNFEIKHYIESSLASNGLGLAAGEGTVEVYTQVRIWKI
jgi:hypothetical protein